MTHMMPPEWDKHERTWIAFPHDGYTLGETPDEQHAARKTWANVANTASNFEKVTAIVHPQRPCQSQKSFFPDRSKSLT